MKANRDNKKYDVLSTENMQKIQGGGYWLVYDAPNGKVYRIWIDTSKIQYSL